MPLLASGHAATTLQPTRPSEMESRGPSRLLEEPPLSQTSSSSTSSKPHTFSTAATKTVTQKDGGAPGEPKYLDKRSLDYILRSGFAGGLAGCAVSTLWSLILVPVLSRLTQAHFVWLFECD